MIEWITYDYKWKTLCYVFKKPSAAEASESVYMRERVKPFSNLTPHYDASSAYGFRKQGGKMRN